MLNTAECIHTEAAWNALCEIVEAIGDPSDLDGALHLIIRSLVQLTGSDRGFLLWLSKAGQLEIGAAVNFELEEWGESAPGYRLAQEALQRRQPLIADDLQPEDGSALDSPRSAICIPLTISGETSGVLYLDSREPGAFSQEELPLLRAFAGQAAIAIKNSHLHETLRQAERA
ncbi:MAG: GAF domain-containing protein, partial [Anaerolineae bacterium]|nr:GAF domain-containing protein [Anaerolineae bacterium]